MAPQSGARQGPLQGLRIVEFAGLGPAPFACMLLADMGAEVVLVDRPGARAGDPLQIVNRGRTLVQADLKNAQDRERIGELIDRADVLVEGFRPGVMERLGLGPEVARQRNPRLVYARMTGWGQDGPLAQAAGHDINYIAITGALAAIGTPERPVVPLNLVGDFGGGSLYLVAGILAAVLEARSSGQGQVVDAAITDGVISLMTLFLSQQQRGDFQDRRESNLLDGGAPWYGVYRTADDRYVSLGALEPQFFAVFCERSGLDPLWQEKRKDKAQWPALRQALTQLLGARTQAQWTALFEGSDACLSPVLPLGEAAAHAHNQARQSFVAVDHVLHPAPAPRFSRTPSAHPSAPPREAECLQAVLRSWQ